jgi:hypothetical protein
MIIETKPNHQMLFIIGAGPFEEGLYVIRENVTMKVITQGNKLWIDRQWAKV